MWYHFIRTIGFVCILAPVVFGVAAYLPNVVRLPDGAIAWAEYAKANLSIVSPLGVIGFGVTQKLRQWLGDPWHKIAVKRFLDTLQKQVFSEVKGPCMINDNRITLYKKTNGGVLKPIARSGPHAKGRTCFRVDDSEHPQGICGAIYHSQSGSIGQDRLPDLGGDGITDEQVHEYAEKTFVSPEWVNQRRRTNRVLPRSYYGLVIEVNNTRWGVLLFDSPADKISRREVLSHMFDSAAIALGILVEKV